MKDIKDIKISVIVPVYNVEQYLDECVKSILAQTHKNLEIILVDDGSPDNCPAKCDEWAKRDRRIKVIHKNNGGASTARNAALNIATGDYIGFVDSDDTIDADMYESLLNYAIDNDLDIASQRVSQMVDSKLPIHQVLNRDEAISLLLDFAMPTGLPFKLVRRNVIKNVRFIEGRTNEDLAFSLEIFKNTEKIGLLNKSMYHYRMRAESVTHSVNAKYFDQIYIYSLYKSDLTSNPATADAALRYEWRMMLHIAHVLRKTGNTKKFADEYKLCHKFVRQNFWRMLHHPKLQFSTKIKATINVF